MKKFLAKYKIEILVFILFVVLHLPSLGHDTFNTDVWKWKTRSYDFGSGVFNLDFEKTIQKYHPGVTLMWIGTVGIKIHNFYYENFKPDISLDSISAVFDLHVTQKVLLVLVLGLCFALIYSQLKRILGKKTSLVILMFLGLEPFYLGLTRVFHLEGLMSTFMILSSLYLYNYLDGKKVKDLIFAGIFSGLAILTKTSAIYMIPFTGLVLFLQLGKEYGPVRAAKKIPLLFLKWFGVLLLTVFILWPALWTHTGQAISAVYRGISVIGIERNHMQIYFGKLVADPGFTFYPVVLFYRSSIFLILGLIGTFFINKKYNDAEDKFINYFLIFAVFYTIQLSIPTKKLDRYILPSLMALSMISSIFYKELFSMCKKFIVPAIGVSLLLVAQVVYWHPNYLAYYSPLGGGLKKGMFVIEPKWMVGQNQIQTYFKNIMCENNIPVAPDESFEELVESNQAENYLTVGFPEKYYTQVWPFIKEIGGWAVIKDLTPFAVHTNYFVYPIWEDDSNLEDRFELQKIDTIKLRGVEIYTVYEKVR